MGCCGGAEAVNEVVEVVGVADRCNHHSGRSEQLGIDARVISGQQLAAALASIGVGAVDGQHGDQQAAQFRTEVVFVGCRSPAEIIEC